MYVHRRSARKKIRTACGKLWQTRRSRRWQQTSAALLWHRKPSEKMTSPRSREDFRVYRQEELFSILMELRPERSPRNRCAKSSVKPRPNCTVYTNKGAITAGSDADIVVLDPAKESVISAATHAYNTDNNPFEGFKLECGIDKVFLRGNLAVEEGKLVKEKLGKYIARGKKQL